MMPTSILIDFSETAYDRLWKQRYDKYLYLRYDIPVRERIGWFLYDGFINLVLPERGKSNLKVMLQIFIPIAMIERIVLKQFLLHFKHISCILLPSKILSVKGKLKVTWGPRLRSHIVCT